MKINVQGGVSDLRRDLTDVVMKFPHEAQGVVRDGARAGNMLARDHARQKSRKHGKHYPRAFSVSVDRPKMLIGLGVYSAEYGPDASKPQGNMSFERGSRNQKPHGSLAKSADIIGPSFAQETQRMVSRLMRGV